VTKQRILNDLNNEWGEGVSGPKLRRTILSHGSGRSARRRRRRWRSCCPRPQRFEKRPDSPYVFGRAGTVMAEWGQWSTVMDRALLESSDVIDLTASYRHRRRLVVEEGMEIRPREAACSQGVGSAQRATR